MQPIDLKVWDETQEQGGRLVLSTATSRSFRVGRQDNDESQRIGLITSPSAHSDLDQKLIIASSGERTYSRHIAEVVLTPETVEIRNTSRHPIFVGSKTLQPNQNGVANLPTNVRFIDKTLRIEREHRPDIDSSIHSLRRSVMAADIRGTAEQTLQLAPDLRLVGSAHDDGNKRLLDLLQTMLTIFQDSPASNRFFDRAALAMVHLLELDHVLIAFHEDHAPEFTAPGSNAAAHGKWRFQSLHQRTKAPLGRWAPSSHIIELLEKQKETVYQIPDVITESLASVTCLVASPLFDANHEIIGFIYCDRNVTGLAAFGDAEAKFVELFANGISLGLERSSREREISEMRACFDQVFTPELARQLESDASLLEPRSAQVSVLFGDIRGFTRISERIGPEATIRWMNSVMNHLSDCVLKHSGAVVDYVGDEILAMWGAPEDRENHAEFAVRAALEMMDQLPRLNAEWQSTIGEPIQLAIGINSGEAYVGNIGSDRKFKYGPLGDVVNVASRMQGATRQLGSRLMVTEQTASMLPEAILIRKIRAVRFVNVQRAIDAYEIPLRPNADWIQLKQSYEQGLALYERGEFHEARETLGSVLTRFPEDLPAARLLSDCDRQRTENSEAFDPVWTLAKK